MALDELGVALGGHREGQHERAALLVALGEGQGVDLVEGQHLVTLAEEAEARALARLGVAALGGREGVEVEADERVELPARLALEPGQPELAGGHGGALAPRRQPLGLAQQGASQSSPPSGAR